MTHSYHRSIIANLAVLLLLYNIIIGHTDSLWYSLALYCMFSISLTVGYHRLFNHKSFECKKIWHYLFGILGCISLNSSPFHWSIVHSWHHKYSDRGSDPQLSGINCTFKFTDSKLKPFANDARLLKDPLHKFLANNSFNISLTYAVMVFGIFGLDGIIFYYIIPSGLLIYNVCMHNRFSHFGKTPRNYPILECLFPLFGEWNHATHHKDPKNIMFHKHYDLGHLLIKVIKYDKVPNREHQGS